uniref:Bromodomain associated domain-containing protein n=1 Tax=Sarcophilus harrisii TaxID=9305 RepID=A0A7N4V6V4_SARHA
ILQSYLSEIGRNAKSYCEHTARTQPTLSDVVVMLVEMGFNVETLTAYAKWSQRMVITSRKSECLCLTAENFFVMEPDWGGESYW